MAEDPASSAKGNKEMVVPGYDGSVAPGFWKTSGDYCYAFLISAPTLKLKYLPLESKVGAFNLGTTAAVLKSTEGKRMDSLYQFSSFMDHQMFVPGISSALSMWV